MKPSSFFHHCPRCGGPQGALPAGGMFHCGSCRFTLYFNATIATAAFITRSDGRLILIRRAKDPAKGKLAPPGGFVDIGERAEEAIAREIREEVGLEVTQLAFLCSQPNTYQYQEVTYPVLDFFFTARAANPDQAQALDDVESLGWFETSAIDLDELAFPSIRAAFGLLRDARTG